MEAVEKFSEEAERTRNEIHRSLRVFLKNRFRGVVTFDKFIQEANTLIDLMKQNQNASIFHVDMPCFRGQSKSSYLLSSTLERKAKKMSVCDYYRKVNEVLPVIETHQDMKWDRPVDLCEITRPDYFDDKIDNLVMLPGKLLFGEFLAFLRHHGFPSPLLDWSESPYVAAYFAFRDARCLDDCKCKGGERESENVAIYMLVKSISGAIVGNMLESQIFEFYQNGKSTPRHYIQQSRYTICLGLKSMSDSYGNKHVQRFFFDSHQSVFDRDSKSSDQYIVVKYEMNSCDRSRVLERLDRMNINEYTLANTVDSLAFWLSQKLFE